VRHIRDGGRNQDRVVELARDWDEIRDEIKREHEVWNQQRNRDLRTPRNTWVPEKPLEQDDAVGNEARCAIACDGDSTADTGRT